MSESENTDVTPGSTATGAGTSMGSPIDGDGLGEGGLDEVGTTEADVTDGRDQKLPKADDDPSVS